MLELFEFPWTTITMGKGGKPALAFERTLHDIGGSFGVLCYILLAGWMTRSSI